MRLGIAQSENFVFRLPLPSPFTIFASTSCKVSRFYEKLDMFILKKIDKKTPYMQRKMKFALFGNTYQEHKSAHVTHLLEILRHK